MTRPSDEFNETELRDEFDWMYEFNSRMSERIRGDADVHSLADYVSKLEDENTRLRSCLSDDTENARMIMAENAKLRQLLQDTWHFIFGSTNGGPISASEWHEKALSIHDRMREL